jgi:hypothetical protein
MVNPANSSPTDTGMGQILSLPFQRHDQFKPMAARYAADV